MEDKMIRSDMGKYVSDDFKDFLMDNGKSPNGWKYKMETWETPNGVQYERHYWTNGTESFYHR